MTATTISFVDFWNSHDVKSVWYTAVGTPLGVTFTHNTETDDDEEYCNLNECEQVDAFQDLEGTINDAGEWEWDGKGDPRDSLGNSILQIKAY